MDNSDHFLYNLNNIKRLARLMDNEYEIPGTRWRFGWDFIIGLVPVLGDALTLLVSGYILFLGRKYTLRKSTWIKMLLNLLIDFFIGSIPVAGDLFDAAYKANARNLKLLIADIEANQ